MAWSVPGASPAAGRLVPAAEIDSPGSVGTDGLGGPSDSLFPSSLWVAGPGTGPVGLADPPPDGDAVGVPSEVGGSTPPRLSPRPLCVGGCSRCPFLRHLRGLHRCHRTASDGDCAWSRPAPGRHQVRRPIPSCPGYWPVAQPLLGESPLEAVPNRDWQCRRVAVLASRRPRCR